MKIGKFQEHRHVTDKRPHRRKTEQLKGTRYPLAWQGRLRVDKNGFVFWDGRMLGSVWKGCRWVATSNLRCGVRNGFKTKLAAIQWVLPEEFQ